MIDALAEMGVTRLSLGGQSFRPEKLRLLERDHEPGDIATAIGLARAAGMQVSLDLIFATPGETLSDWDSDLEAAHRSRAGSCFDLRPHLRARHGFLEPPASRRAGSKSTKSCSATCMRWPSTGSRPPASSTTKSRTSPGPAAARGTTRRIGRATAILPPAPAQPATSTAFARRIIAARRPT